MVEKSLKGGICHSVLRYAKANNKYMKHYNRDNDSSYVTCLDKKYLHELAITQKLPVDEFDRKRLIYI